MNYLVSGQLKAEFLRQAQHPPGSDPVLGGFYSALHQLISSSHPFTQTINKVYILRSGITVQHLVNLAFRAFQAVKFKKEDLSYLNNTSAEKWTTELDLFVKNSADLELYTHLLQTKSTTSTIYQRYIGPSAIISNLFDKKPITIADLGCGGNYGLRGIATREPFLPIIDSTPNQIVIASTPPNKYINLHRGLAVDQEDPDCEEVRNWRYACSVYPKENHLLPKLKKFEERIQRCEQVDFMNADLLNMDPLPDAWADVLILSTMLYQLQPKDQLILIDRAKKTLKPNGLLIVQDFACLSTKKPLQLDFRQSWGKLNSYRTFIAGNFSEWKFLEVFIWNNGRCLAVIPGKDFDFVFGENQENSAKAAFAHSKS